MKGLAAEGPFRPRRSNPKPPEALGCGEEIGHCGDTPVQTAQKPGKAAFPVSTANSRIAANTACRKDPPASGDLSRP